MYRLNEDGFEIVNTFLTEDEVSDILEVINKGEKDRPTVRRSNALFAIRQFIIELPEIYSLIFTPGFGRLLEEKAGLGYELVQSIYFDKPGQSNWFVSYHQD